MQRGLLSRRTYELVAWGQAGHRALLQLHLDASAPRGLRPGPSGDHQDRHRRGRAVHFARVEFTDTEFVYEYSPESFTGTDLDYALEVCNAVVAVIDLTPERPMILNLPATVEMYTRTSTPTPLSGSMLRRSPRQRLDLLHLHNDRGTAVRAAELGVLAGADRVEGTLFGNGERTGNVDVVTLALNLFAQRPPRTGIRDIDKARHVAEYASRLPVHMRHPYVAELVYTAFSGSHQDAIKKGMTAIGEGYEVWEVPYLPIDPKHTGAPTKPSSASTPSPARAASLTPEHRARPRSAARHAGRVLQAGPAVDRGDGHGDLAAEIWDVFTTTYSPRTRRSS